MRLFTILILSNLLWFAAPAQDIPVDYHTGRPAINIPLCQANDRSLSHGLGLVYDASGVKVDNPGGKVGQNWSLVAGGEVRRELRGLPDEYYPSGSDSRRGWLHNNNASSIGNFSYPADGSVTSCNDETPVYNFISNFNYNADTEPDLFHFSAGDISGTFVFDNTGNIDNVRLIPYQDIQVKPFRITPTSSIYKFEIITAFGTKYVFDIQETSEKKAERITGVDPFHFRREYHQYKNSLVYTRAWKLREIVSSSGEKISFNYHSRQVNEGTRVTVHIKDAVSSDFIPTDLYATTEAVTLQTLEDISTLHQQIDLEHLDALTSDHVLLQRITIREISALGIASPVKTIDFHYATAYSTHVDHPTASRLFLKNIVIGDNCQQYNPYTFSYHGTTLANGTTGTTELPGVGSKHKDIWGYYISNNTAYTIPKFYIYPGQQGIHRISLYRQTGLPGEIIIDGADRLSSTTPVAGVLSKITYPSGSTATLQYSAHEFYNPVTGGTSGGGGLRVSSIALHDGISVSNDIVRTYEYVKPNGASSGKLMALPTFWELSACYKDPTTNTVTDYPGLLALSTEEQWKRMLLRTESNLDPNFENTSSTVTYERVTEKISNGKGKIVYQYNVPFVYGDSPAGDWSPTYTHLTRGGACPSTALVNAGYYATSIAVPTPYDFARGTLSSIAHFAENDNSPLKETLYTYQDKSVSGTNIKGLRYEIMPYNASGYFFGYGDYLLVSNKLKVLSQTVQRVRDRNNPTNYIATVTDHTYGANHAFIVANAVTNSDGTVRTERFKYAKDYGLPGVLTGDLQVNAIDALNLAGQTGVLVEHVTAVTISGQPEKTIQGNVSFYKNFGTVSNPVIRASEVHSLQTDGITGFNLSSFGGSGASRTFDKHGAYKKDATYRYKSPGDLISVETQRQVRSTHPDNLSGLPVATIMNAEPEEVIYSGFDHNTDYDFDLPGFTTPDRSASGRTGDYGLGGWTAGSGKYLRARLKKKNGSRYLFSAWYKPAVAGGAHTLEVIIRNLSETQLQSHTVTYSATNTDWLYEEKLIDISTIADAEVFVEVRFSGSYSSASTSVLDEVLFAPEGVEVTRNTYKFPYGVSSVTAPDGTIMKNEYDASGKLKYVRDHDDNIVQKKSYTNFAASAGEGSPISFTVPVTIYDTSPTQFTAKLACVDVASIMWKVTPANDPSGGSFFSGTPTQPYTFSAPGVYIVTLRVSHSTYGTYESSQYLSVLSTPLTVDVCVSQGATDIDRCVGTTYQYVSCEGILNPPVAVGKQTTTFEVFASGCSSGATYTYKWETRPHGVSGAAWTHAGTASSVTINNITSYDVRCLVTSSCGRSGEGIQTVSIYSSDPNCLIGDGPDGD